MHIYMASTNCYTVNIHSYRFCVSYIGVSVSRVGPTRTAYSIFLWWDWLWDNVSFEMTGGDEVNDDDDYTENWNSGNC